MSYPFIGIKDFGVEKWDAAAVEKVLRDGARIYLDPDGSEYAYYADGKFRFCAFLPIHDPKKRQETKKEWEFESFLELAAWVAFDGKEFL